MNEMQRLHEKLDKLTDKIESLRVDFTRLETASTAGKDSNGVTAKIVAWLISTTISTIAVYVSMKTGVAP